MFKTIKWIIICVLLLAVTIGACLYFIPQTTTINLTLETLKTDRSGNALGSVTITVTGTWEKYLLQDDRLVLTIDDFDHLYNIRPWTNNNVPYFTEEQGDVNPEVPYHYVTFVADSTITGKDSVFLSLAFRDDLTKWEFFTGPSVYTSDDLRDDPSLQFAYRATVD